MTVEKLYQVIAEVCPNAQFGEDFDGQLVIYTGLYEKDDGTLGDLDEMEVDIDE